ncbi:MAG TPA: lipoprotein [Paucimonas sp.]|nr:lipoprotein [Paucimonas sp.]HJW57440.1 lipoprotein [Burkholderiaceae bacterium]
MVILIVKLYCNWSRRAVFSIAIGLSGLLSACGQRGPLYLPSKPAQDILRTQPVPAPSPVPTDSNISPSK